MTSVERIDPQLDNDELTMMCEFLDYHRSTLTAKLDGLSQNQLGQRLGPSELTIAGLVKHMAYVEDCWFTNRMAGRAEGEPWTLAPFDDDPDWEFHSAPSDTADELRALYAESCGRSRAVIADIGDPSARSVASNREGTEHYTLRWILLHMIEETARHNGHADLIRESIDGTAGE